MGSIYRAAHLFAVFLIGHSANAQSEYSSFTVTGSGLATTRATDYQSIGINPSNLGWTSAYEGKHFALGLAEICASIYTDAVDKRILRKDVITNFDTRFTRERQEQAAQDLANAEFAVNADVRAIGFAVTTEKLGGFAFHVADRFQWYSKFNTVAAQLMFLGRTAPYFENLELSDGTVIENSPDLDQATIDQVVQGFNLQNEALTTSTLLDGSELRLEWVRQYALSWGRSVGRTGAVEWYVGLGGRYLTGFAYVDIGSEERKLEAFSSLSPGFKIDYDTAGSQNPSTRTGTSFKPVGRGFSGDIGVSALIDERMTIGLALTNFGSITWNGNVYTASDDTLFAMDSEGFISHNIFDNAELITSETGIFSWQGLRKETRPTASLVRAGASIRLKEKSHIGFDLVVPTNDVAGSFGKVIFNVGGEVTFVPWVTLSAGISTGGNYRTRIPFGITLRVPTGVWELGVATRDVVSFVSKNRPLLSACVGLLRFRF